ncbi:hypothetical protein LXL04_037954 [Taraxacum kok-saghyz]
MGYQCDHCGEARSMVYCRSDAAYLCLSCDRIIHSANALSKRHSRTLVCDRCNSQPAVVRCVEEKVSLCQNCDWAGHNNRSNTTHSRQTLNCYSGCPSAVELSNIWSFMTETPLVIENSCEQGMGSMSIADNSQGPSRSNNNNNNNNNNNYYIDDDYNNNQDLVVNESNLWRGSSSVRGDDRQENVGQHGGPLNSSTLKISHSGKKDGEACDDDGFYVDFNMDEVDLSIENYEELFGVGHNDPEHLFAKDGIDCLFGGAESNCHGAYGAKEASGDSLRSCKTEPNPNCNYTRQHSNISFSSLTGESMSSAGEYQDCGASSSMLLMGEPPPPWCLQGGTDQTSTTTTALIGSRSDAVLRYREKKKMRKFEKRVRYATRKARADVRKRVKGRFVKAGDAYDYDPMSQTRSF